MRFKIPEHKWQSAWKGQSSPQKTKHYELRGEIARKAFLAIRSRTESDFIRILRFDFVFIFLNFLKEEDYGFRCQLNYTRIQRKVRTLTMLALSANGYSPKSEKQGENQ